MRQPDYYELLGVAPDATHDTIHARFRSIILRLSSDPASASRLPPLAQVHEAFRTLGDPVARVYYDRARRPEAAPPAEVPPTVQSPAEPREPATCPFCEAAIAADVVVGADIVCQSCQAPLSPAQYEASRPDSRRMLDRLPFSMRVTFARAASPQVMLKGISDDVSLGGMRLHTAEGMDVGERIFLRCDFCTAVAIVRHVHRGSSSTPFLCGVQFLTLHLERRRGGLLSTTA